MKITDVKIDGFGIWSNLAVRRLSGDVTVFYGPNEAGKTTLMQFMRAVLYGFSRERRGRYLPPVHGGQAGGLLELSSPRGNYEVRRHLSRNDAPESLGHLELMDEGGSPLGTHTLSAILGGVDESIFTNVFAIGLKEMQELGALNDSAAADHLYKLTSGLDRVSLIDVVRDLATARRDVVGRQDEPGELSRLLQKQTKLQAEIEELATRGRRWPQLLGERQARSEEIDRVERTMSDLQRQSHHYDVLLSARDKWTSRRHLDDQLTALGTVAELPANAIEQLETINTRLRKLKRRLKACRTQRLALREELAKHVYNRNLLAQSGRIQALGEHSPWITSLEEEVARLTADTVALEREIEARRPQIDMPAGTSRSKLPEITSKTLAVLREPATRLNHLLKLVDRTQHEASAIKQRSEQTLQRVSSELQDLDESSLSAALEKAGTRVAQLRRRIQVEERIEQLTLQHADLDGDSNDLFDGQVMPLEKMVWLFSSFVISSVLILTGVFGGMLWGLSWFLGLMMTFLGFVGLGASIVWKLDWERNAEREWQSCERQLEMLEQQLAEAKAERHAIDEQLPAGGGPLDARLAHAERQLQHLEQLAPMDAQRHESGQHVDAAERRAAKASEDLKDARRNWQTALKTAGLPETLTPHDVRHLARGFRVVIGIRRQLEQRRDDLEARRREFAALAGRINELFVELGIVAESDSPPAQLRQLATVLSEQQQIAERRRDVQRQLKQWHARYRQAFKGFESANRQRRSLLDQANANNEQELRQMVARQHQLQLLRTPRDEVGQQLRSLLGEMWSDEAASEEFLAQGTNTPEQKKVRLTERHQALKAELTRLHEERGQLGAEMKAMIADRRLDEAKLELGSVEQQIQAAARRWQILAVTGQLLESVRGIYETTRQPETLREASLYLQRLTQDQYVRIWTPIEEKVLRVEDQHGVSLSLDKLSSGTREAVFLSLRLALVAGYARRGAKLPLILDDVLVNFDSSRVRAAAMVLRDFARQGYQLLLFTCHEHIMEIFRSIDAEIRMLPGRDGTFGEWEKPEPVVALVPEPEEEPALAPATVAEAEVESLPAEEEPQWYETVHEPELEPVASHLSAMEEQHEATIRFPVPDFEYRLADPEPVSTFDDPLVSLFTIPEEPREEPSLVSAEAPPMSVPVVPPTTAPRARKVVSSGPLVERRFTWESPEMYWRERDDEAVA